MASELYCVQVIHTSKNLIIDWLQNMCKYGYIHFNLPEVDVLDPVNQVY